MIVVLLSLSLPAVKCSVEGVGWGPPAHPGLTQVPEEVRGTLAGVRTNTHPTVHTGGDTAGNTSIGRHCITAAAVPQPPRPSHTPHLGLSNSCLPRTPFRCILYRVPLSALQGAMGFRSIVTDDVETISYSNAILTYEVCCSGVMLREEGFTIYIYISAKYVFIIFHRPF